MDHIVGRLKEIERNIEIVGADLISLHGFTQVPNFILNHKDISIGGKIYYAMLLKYAREKDLCFPGQQTLAKDIGASERSVRTYQKELEDAGFLEVIHRGLGQTSLYRIDIRVERGGKVMGGGKSSKVGEVSSNPAGPDRQNLPV